MFNFKKARHRKKSAGRTHIVIQTVLSILLIKTLYTIGMLPTKTVIHITLLLCLLLGFTILTLLKGKGKAIAGKIVSLVIIMFLLFGTFYMSKINSAMQHMTNDSTINGALTNDATMKKPFNVYISGIDVYGDIDKTSRSDVNIIATVNPNTHQILLTTTPRDYYVPITGISGGQNDKLTHAGIYGVSASMQTLEELSILK